MIRKAKVDAWSELIKCIEDDPWGLPYRIVMGKLRRAAPGLTETLDPVELESLMESFFPAGEAHEPAREWAEEEVPVDFPDVTSQVLAMRRGNSGRSLGPDGISLSILRRVTPGLIEFMAGTPLRRA